MNKHYLLIQNFKRTVTFFLLLVLSLGVKTVFGQNIIPVIDINVNIKPPYSPFYSDYSGSNADKVFFMINNLTATPYKIKLVGLLSGDNGIRITTKSNYVPANPIILGPNEHKQMNGTALRDIFDINSLNVYGVDKSRLIYTSRLPEGNYTLCVTAVDMGTGKVLSSQAPLGCSLITIAYPEPPILLGPLQNGKITALNPQNVQFVWANAGFVPLSTQYILQVAEMPDVAANPNQVLNSTSFPMINKTLNGLTYVSTLVDPPFKLNKRYAWRVKSYDAAGKVVFKNDGVSGANVFTYSLPEVVLPAPQITSPLANAALTGVKNMFGFYTQPNTNITWASADAIAGSVQYGIKISKLTKGITPAIALDNNTQLIVNDSTTATNYEISPPNAFDTADKLKGKGDKRKVKLDSGATYAVQITTKVLSGSNYRFSNLGKSQVVVFTYKSIPNAIVQANLPPPITSTINGKLFYRFKNVDEVPNSASFTLPPKTVMKQMPEPLNVSIPMPNDAPYPDFVANGRFNNKNSKALKNVKLYFRYAILQTTSDDPKNLADFKEPKAMFNSDFSTHVMNIGGFNITYNIIVNHLGLKTATDGSFSFKFLNNYKLGYIGKESSSGLNSYGVIQVVLKDEHSYYCSPDILMFPKPGQDMTLPDEVVFVNSYNADVLLKTDPKIKDQALQPGSVLANYPVQMLDTHKFIKLLGDGAHNVGYDTDMEDDPETMPAEANSENYAGMQDNVGDESLPVVDIVKTDANGWAHFTNLLPIHKHTASSMNNPFEGSLSYKNQSAFIKPSGKDINGVDYQVGGGFGGPEATWLFNSDFTIITAVENMVLQPKNPEIYLRAVSTQQGITKGVQGATVKIWEFEDANSPSDKYYEVPTDDNGYIHLTDLPLKTEYQAGVKKVIGPQRTIVISKSGYYDHLVGGYRQLLMPGERFPAQTEQTLTGMGKVIGRVMNQNGDGIVSNVRVDGGPFVKTSASGWFAIDNCHGGYSKIEVVPSVDNYFAETFYQNIGTSGTYTWISNVGTTNGEIRVTEKLHRVQFKVVDQYGNPVAQSCTSVGKNLNICYPSNSNNGLTNEIAIASPSDEFRVRTVADGYVTYDDYISIANRKTAKVITITLIKGQTISGYVRDAKTKAAIPGARVYTVTGSNEDGEVQNQTLTDDNGHYTLTGAVDRQIWLSYFNMYQPLPITVYAVKSGAKAYIRQSKDVMGVNGQGSVDFELTALNAKGEIWGIPVEISESTRIDPKNITISGSFVKLPGNSTFKPALGNARLPFKNIPVKLDEGEFGNLKGFINQPSENTIKPVNSSIPLETSSFKVLAFDQFSCEVLGSINRYDYPKLSIQNNNGCGSLNGFVTSQLDGFNFSYSYTGKFLFTSGIRTPGKPLSPSAVLAPANCTNVTGEYTLRALYDQSSFKVHDFSATLSSGSFVNKDGFNIKANVNLTIPLVTTAVMPAGTIKVTNNDITWNEYTGPINIALEKWSITGSGLQYEVNQGGFRVTDGKLQTNLPQVPLSNLIIMPTRVDLGENKLTGNEPITLAGVAPLHLTYGSKLTLMYDDAATFDQKPHYRINVNSANKVVAYISNIPGISGMDMINLNMLSAYSDGIHQTINVDPAKHKFFNVVSQTISGIELGSDNFILIGNTDLDIPGCPANVTGRFKYNKSLTDPKRDANNVVCTVEKLQTDLELPGKVKFNGNTFTLENNLFTTTGDMIMYKNTPGDGVKVTATITKTPGNTVLVIKPGERLMGSAKRMTIKYGGSHVQNNAWDLVKFTAKPEGFTAAGGTRNVLKADGDLIDFVVNGAISNDADSKKTIKLDGIDTPFGGFALTLDFEKKVLQGSLTITGAHVVLGPVTIVDGTIDMQIDDNGFILAGAITNAELTPIPIFAGFKSGIALGFYDGQLPAYMKNNLLGVTLYNELPGIDDGLKGFYVNVMKSLSEKDLPTIPGPSLHDIPLLGSFVPTFKFSGGADVRVCLNFDKTTEITIGGKAFASIAFLMSIGVCDIGVSSSTAGDFQLKYLDGLTGYIKFDIGAKVVYCVGDVGFGIDLTLEKNTDGFGFSVKPKF